MPFYKLALMVIKLTCLLDLKMRVFALNRLLLVCVCALPNLQTLANTRIFSWSCASSPSTGCCSCVFGCARARPRANVCGLVTLRLRPQQVGARVCVCGPALAAHPSRTSESRIRVASSPSTGCCSCACARPAPARERAVTQRLRPQQVCCRVCVGARARAPAFFTHRLRPQQVCGRVCVRARVRLCVNAPSPSSTGARPATASDPGRSSESHIRVAHPSCASESRIRVAHPIRASVTHIRVAHPSRASESHIRVTPRAPRTRRHPLRWLSRAGPFSRCACGPEPRPAAHPSR